MQPRISNRSDMYSWYSCGRILTNLADVIGGFKLFVTIVFLSVFPLKICSQKILISGEIILHFVIVMWSLSRFDIVLTISSPLSLLTLLQLMPSLEYDNLYDVTHWSVSLLPCVWMAVILKGSLNSAWTHWLPSFVFDDHDPLYP